MSFSDALCFFALLFISDSLPLEKRYRKKSYGSFILCLSSVFITILQNVDKYNPLMIIVAITTKSIPESLN